MDDSNGMVGGLARRRDHVTLSNDIGTRTGDIVAPVALVLLCLAPRVVNLTALPIFFDESVYTRAAEIVGAAPSGSTLFISLHYGALPLFSWLAAPMTRIVSDPLLAVRLTSALLGAACMLGVWATARVLWGRGEALLAGALYAVCPFTLFYSRLALLDGLVAACGVWALFFTLRLSRRGQHSDAAALGLCLAGGMMTKMFSVTFLLLPLLSVIAAPSTLRDSVRRSAWAAALCGVMPLLAVLLTPQGAGLLSATHAHARYHESPLAVVSAQLAGWAGALWLYLTPPLLAFALYGLWRMRDQRDARVLGVWALLGGLPPVLVPAAFVAPRYYLYIAAPAMLLAAHGAGQAATTTWHVVPRRLLARAATLGIAIALAVPAVQADAAIVATPALAPLTSFDRWQYVTGWPSGFALMRVVAYLRRRASHGPVRVISSIYDPPGDALAVLLGRDRSIALSNVDFASLSRRPLKARTEAPIYLIACRPYGQPLRPDLRRLRVVLHASNGDRVGGIDVYEVKRT